MAHHIIRRVLRRRRSGRGRSRGGSAVIGPDLSCREVDAALCDLLARSRQQVLATPLRELVHPDDLPRALQALLDGLREELARTCVDIRLLCADGRALPVGVSASAARDGEGRIVHHVVRVRQLG